MARYALVIGVAKYDNFRNLPKAVNDAEQIAKLLREHGRFDVQPLPGKLIESENQWQVTPDKKLTGKELGQALRLFLLEKAKGSEALIYFAGHGFEAPSLTGEPKGYLATSDCHKDGQNAIAFDDLNTLIAKSQLSNLVVLLNCCYAGSLLERSIITSSFSVFNSKQDYCLITASRAFERASSSPEGGIFTKAVIKALSKDRADETTGEVNANDLMSFVSRELKGSGQEAIYMGGGRSIPLVFYKPTNKLFENKHLEQRHHALQRQYDLEAEKLKELRFTYAIEASAIVRFQLEKQIEQTEAELKELEQQLDQLERSSSNKRVYRALFKLGYRQQTQAFRRFVEAHPLGAFLIHGSPEYGQRWLLNRLVVQHVPSLNTGKVIKIELNRIGRRSDIAALWREVGGRVGLGRQSTIEEIVERLYQRWRTQDVLLIFSHVDSLSEVFLQELIRDFWQPLVNKVISTTQESASQFRLLMFLVDYDGCVGSWNIPFAETIDPTWNPYTPFKLPVLTKFSGDELTNWLEYEAEELPTNLINQIDETVQIILKNSNNGIPELALAEICHLSGFDLYEEEEKWLSIDGGVTRLIQPEQKESLDVVNPFPVTQSEPIVCFHLFFNISSHSTTVGRELAVTVELSPDGNDNRNAYLLEVSRTEAIGSELNIFLTAPSFQFNSDNTTSLPIDPDTANVNQTASFNLTALRSGITKIKAELYTGETYKNTLETEVEVTAFEETELRPLIAARSRPVPQPDIILQVRTTWNADISACTFNYHIDSYQPRLLFADDVDYNSQSLSNTWVERSHSLLKTTLEEAASSLPDDFRSRLVSLGQYLFQCLLPEELQNTFRTIASFNHPFTLLILADQDAWFLWELLHDGQKFLGDRFIIGRWLWELEKARPYEFPVGAINVAHYANVEQAELWTELLQSSGAPPPISIQASIFDDISLFESIRGLHLIRYGQSVDITNRQDAPVRVNSSTDIQDIESEVQPAKLSLRRNHPLVSLSYLNAGQPELTALEQTWASTFVRAGCSVFIGSLWAVQPNVEAVFASAFYNSIWAGQTLGVAFQTACRLAKTVVPESLDWLAYVLFGDPMARPYRPVQGQGYAVVEPIGQEIDDPVSPGNTVRFRVSLRRTPPVWYENRLMEVAEDLSFDNLRVFIVTSGLQVTPGDSILMTRTATGDYLGWFTLTVPTEMEGETVLVQVYYEDGEEPIHNLRFLLKIDTSSLPNYSLPRTRNRQQIPKQRLTERGGDVK